MDRQHRLCSGGNDRLDGSGVEAECFVYFSEHGHGTGKNNRLDGCDEVNGGTMTSSPAPIPQAANATQRAAVPLEQR